MQVLGQAYLLQVLEGLSLQAAWLLRMPVVLLLL